METQTAAQSYSASQKEIKALLKNIKTKMPKHEAAAKGTGHWGYTGDLNEVKQLLDQASRMLNTDN